MAAEKLTHQQAANALQKAVQFFRAQVSTEGGYLWRYSSDLKKREGEGKASASTVWVQPPGTPAIGAVYLRAYQRAEDAYYLEAAVETGLALVNGQLASGGWDYGSNSILRNEKSMPIEATMGLRENEIPPPWTIIPPNRPSHS